MNLRICSASFALSILISPVTAQTVADVNPNHWEVDVGLNYLKGDFGFSRDTTLWMQATTIHYREDPVHFQVMVPVLSIEGPASIIGDVGRPMMARARGLGDVTISGTYKFADGLTGISNWDVTARMKIPTADEEKGLGTGETGSDFEVGYHRKLGAFTPFATIGYRVLGDSAIYQLQNGFYTTAGVAKPLSEETVGGVAVSWREKLTATSDNAMEAMIFLSHDLDAKWKLQGFALTGFTDASPDVGFGGLVGLRF